MRGVGSVRRGAHAAVLDKDEESFLASFIQMMGIPSLLAAVLGAVVYLDMQDSSWKQQFICLTTTGSAAFAGLLLLSARLKLSCGVECFALFLVLLATCSHILQGVTQIPGTLPPEAGFFQAVQAALLFLAFAAALAAFSLHRVMNSR